MERCLQRLALAFCFLVSVARPAFAADTSVDALVRAPVMGLAPAALLALRSPHLPAGLDVDWLLDETNFKLDPQGRLTVETRYVYRILGEDGIKNWSGVSRAYHPWHHDKPVIHARVVTPDGQAHELDPTTLVDGAVGNDGKEQYSDGRELSGPLPAVKVGSVIEVHIVLAEHRPLFDAGRLERETFSTNMYCALMRATIDVPPGLPFIVHLRSTKDKLTTAQVHGHTVYTFEQRDVLPLRERPAATDPDMAIFPNLEFATGKSWHDIAEAYGKIVEAKLVDFDAKPIVARVVGDAKTDVEKVHRLVAWLHQEVRYTGLELGERSIVPATPQEAMARRYGDCKDQSTLLVGLLRAAGVDAQVAILSTGPGLDVATQLPGFGLFNHAIVVARVGGVATWIDPTDTYAVPGELQYGDQDRFALVASSHTTALVRTPRTSAAASTKIDETEVTFSDLGPASVRWTYSGTGPAAAAMRGVFDRDDAQLKERMQEYMHKRFTTHIETAHSQNATDIDKPFALVITAKDAEVFETADDGGSIRLSAPGLLNDLPDTLLLAPVESREKDDRKPDPREREAPALPVYISEPSTVHVRYKLALADGFAFQALPEPLALNTEGIRVARRAEQTDPQHATLDFEVVVEARVIAVDKVEKIRQMMDTFAKDGPVQVRFVHVAREAMDRDDAEGVVRLHRALVAKHPQSIPTRARYIRDVLSLGFVMSGRAEAEKLVKEFPDAPQAHVTLGLALWFDQVGREARPGAEMAQAEAQIRAAVAKDPEKEQNYRLLVAALEYQVSRSMPRDKVRTAELIATLETLRTRFKAHDKDNTLAGLYLWENRFRDAQRIAEEMEVSTERNGLLVTAIAAQNGASAAQRRAEQLVHGDLRTLLQTVRATLIAIGRYDLAAPVANLASMAEKAGGSTKPLDSVLRQAQCMADMKPAAKVTYAFLQEQVVRASALTGDYPLLDLPPYKDTSDSFSLARVLNTLAKSATEKASSVATLRFVVDTLPCYLRWDVEEREGAVRVRPMGDTAAGRDGDDTFYLRKVKSGYRMLGARVDGRSRTFGMAMQQALADKKPEEARVWLEWAKDPVGLEGVHKQTFGHEDAMLALWPAHPATATTEDLGEIATALLPSWALKDADMVRMDAAAKRYAGEPDKLHATQFMHALGLASLEKPAESVSYFDALHRAFPEDQTLHRQLIIALRQARKPDQLRKELDAFDAKWPDQWSVAVERNIQDRRDGKDAEVLDRVLKRLADHKATKQELNNAAWDAIFVGGDLQKAIRLAEAACDPATQATAASLHTLATLYAETGQYGKGLRMLRLSMEKDDAYALGDPEWYTWGRLAEGLGLLESARDSYGHIKKGAKAGDFDLDEWAQRRMAKMK